MATTKVPTSRTTAKSKKAKPGSRAKLTTAAKREEPDYNTLAWKLADKHAATLDYLWEILQPVAEISEPKGVVYDFANGKAPRRATNREAGLAELSIVLPDDSSIDLRGDIGAQVATSLRNAARELRKAASRVERAGKRGDLSMIVKGHYVRKNDEDVYGPVTESKANAFAAKVGGKVVRRLTDDRERVQRDYETENEAAA